MRHWQQLNDDDRITVIEITSADKGLPLLAVEKDWWVTVTLKALSMTRYFRLMSFKGGTSLSKGWNLINRFSEDIDIALRREGDFAISSITTSQLAKVRRKARHYIIRELPDELDHILQGMGVHGFSVEPETERIDASGNIIELGATTHPSTIFITYQSVLHDISEYVMPKVKIEISCLSMDEPVENKNICSLISDVLKEEDLHVVFPTVSPARTFLEKIFLLHEEFQKDTPKSKRMSRHMYDIEKIMDTPFGKSIYDKELYDEIVSHRSSFNNINGIDYSRHARSTLSFVPPKAILPEWEKDYISMCNNFIFDEICLPFPELLKRIILLNTRIRNSVNP